MKTHALRELTLPPVDQIGFVVKDIASAIERYTPLFGDFTLMDAADMEWDYRGTPEVSSIKVAFARSGDLEIELIEWVSGKTPHKEFLDAGHEGMHHLRFSVDDIEEKVKHAETCGYQQIWYKRFAQGLASAYLEREGDPLIIEFFENNQG
jgi:catechol 2,3-dioxygenase-like lactoylglutathione lyase family enzyme